MQRRAAERRFGGGGDVVHLAVGDGDDAGEPRPRDVAKRTIDGREQAGAFRTGFRHGDRAQLEVRQAARFRLDFRARGFGELSAIADAHAGGLVDDKQPDIRQRLACFLHEPRAREPQQQHGEGEEAPHGAGRAPPKGDGERENGETGEPASSQTGTPGSNRIAAMACSRCMVAHAHCPSRSRMAGTWTWSPL